MSTTTQSSQFGKWRSKLWPVHAYEVKKFLPMGLLLFFILFNYTILRDTKDTLIVTAPGSGAEAIPFLKVWGVLPFAVVFLLVYSKLSNKLSKPKLFYSTISFFIVFFALFIGVFYPLRESLHPNALCDTLQSKLPEGCQGLIALIRNWTYALFYIMSELWGSVALSLLFWGFANDTTKISESKRFYSLFGTFANFALLVSGPLIVVVSNIRGRLPAHVDAWQVSLNYLIGMVLISCFIIIGIYWWINKNVLTDPRFYSQEEQSSKKKEKPKMSIKESFGYLMRSKYIGCIAVLVLAYGICINLVEVTWKSQLKLQYPNSNDYSAFMGKFSTLTGAITILMTTFVGGNLMRRFGWKVTALIAPLVLIVTGSAFFSFVIFKDSLGGMIATLGSTPLMLAVIVGMMQNILSKSTKYACFDPTKESAYIPLDQESKVKGKAAVDVVGARLGKSGGALIQQGLILKLGSIANITKYVAGIIFLFVAAWLFAVHALNKRFLALTKKSNEEESSSEKEAPTKSAAAQSASS